MRTTDIIQSLAATTERLGDLVGDENIVLQERQPHKLSTNFDEKDRLVTVYEQEMAELRANPVDLKNIYIPVEKGSPVPLSELAEIRYEQGPQAIKSEDTFLVGYVLFDKMDGFAEVDVVENAQAMIKDKIDKGVLVVPKGINYSEFPNDKSISTIINKWHNRFGYGINSTIVTHQW